MLCGCPLAIINDFELGALHFHFALNPTNYIANPGNRKHEWIEAEASYIGICKPS
jgi:hypothetical protein